MTARFFDKTWAAFAGLRRAWLQAFLILLFAFLGQSANAAPDALWSATSPNGHLMIEMKAVNNGQLNYRVVRDGSEVLGWSRLGLVVSSANTELTRTTADLSQDLTFDRAETTGFHDTFTLKIGKRLENVYDGIETRVTFHHASGRSLEIALRAYDEGVAFRYKVLGVGTAKDAVFYRVDSELTTFNASPASRFYGQPYDFVDGWRPSYETPALSGGLPAGTAADPVQGTGFGFPMLFSVGNAWMLIHESGLTDQYHGMHIAPEVINKTYSLVPPFAGEGNGVGPNYAEHALPWTLPWRVFIVGGLDTIVQSNLVAELADPSRVADDSWVKPGISSWAWLSSRGPEDGIGTLYKFIDFAADMGWRYSLIDADWDQLSPTSLRDLVAHADKRGVGLFFWYNSGGPNNNVEGTPRNRLHDPMIRRKEFAMLQAAGVKGIKVDFWQSDKQTAMQSYMGLLSDAAEFHLMVNLHGSTIPRGWERTYPNLVSMEAVRGYEFYTFASKPDYGRLSPGQNALLPFARNVIGPMDATPMLFKPKLVTRYTTAGHEAALGTVFEVGVLHPSDSVAAYSALPDAWKTYLRTLPTAWDDTRLLAGEPGQYAVMARRKGNQWWIAGINGEATSRKLKLDLSFVSADQVLLSDGSTDALPYNSKEVRLSKKPFEITLKPFGGFVLYPK